MKNLTPYILTYLHLRFMAAKAAKAIGAEGDIHNINVRKMQSTWDKSSGYSPQMLISKTRDTMELAACGALLNLVGAGSIAACIAMLLLAKHQKARYLGLPEHSNQSPPK
ncbi:hypothetical protein [Rivihabitans pingtungensis]|jgi:hypothetical protein|uniref:Uncharacterized protein n=1 Tax=Rivihabitans pingtungensis TaxID=1054498 RepID=A0A318KJG6_9NEIS|nr:hypothetical protein [Rivihabitans pingtungensis]PXX78001.1 hypothetical protein DFR34_11310 [Rivihabitans pingtungensis]